jgi:radical SAM protein with 4Fe4S-binding SPASM domain
MVVRHDDEALRRQSVTPLMDKVAEKLFEGARRIIDGQYRITMSTSADVFIKPSPLRDQHPHAFNGSVRSAHPQAKGTWTPRTAFQRGHYPGMPVECRSPFTFARVSFDGDVQLCHQFKVGNLHRDVFDRIWYGPEATKVRTAVMRSARICHACDYYRFCVNSGRIDFEDERNSFNGETLGKDDPQYQAPALIETVGKTNVVRWLGGFYGIPHRLGHVDVRLLDTSCLPEGVLLDNSLEGLRLRLGTPVVV